MIKKIYLLPVLLILFSISSCSLYEDVEMLGVQNYDFESVPGSQVKASIVFKINNPNFYSITMKKSDFTVLIDDEELGVAGMENDLKIIKKTEGDYTLGLLLQENDIRNALIPLIKKAIFKKSVTFRVKGKAQAKVWGIFGKKIEVNEKKEVLVADLMSKLKLK